MIQKKKKKKEKNEMSTGVRKQEEAREKRGMLGRFTRFLSDSISDSIPFPEF